MARAIRRSRSRGESWRLIFESTPLGWQSRSLAIDLSFEAAVAMEVSLVAEWVFGAVWAAYLILQVFALCRLHGDTRRRGMAVLKFMLIAILLANGMRLIFGGQTAKELELVIMSALGVGGIIMLARLFRLEEPAGLLKADS